VIPPEFDYTRVSSVDEAVKTLGEAGEDAKLLAGGHSLLPLMKLRLAAPSLLVDIGKVDGLRGVERSNGGLRIGALTRHADLQDREELGVLGAAAGKISDQQVRNRGTIGGSLAHGDPASDLPGVVLALDGSVSATGPNGEREIAAADLFQDYLTTALEPDEVLTSVSVADPGEWSFGYEKFVRRSEDWAMVGVSALLKIDGGTVSDARVGLTHMGSTPLRATAVEEALKGGDASREAIASAAEHAAEGTDPPGDLNATSEYKQHLARVLTRRALETAAGA
jgi:aerobic carbon-monoxide dehydrogenase medium subunit